jgi:hypothetical protein
MGAGGTEDTTMSDTDHGGHGAAAPATGHGHDAHGHEEAALGPIDWRMWGVGLAGVIAALVIVAGFVTATNFAFNA